jgi:hypothetical protein
VAIRSMCISGLRGSPTGTVTGKIVTPVVEHSTSGSEPCVNIIGRLSVVLLVNTVATKASVHV